MSLIPIEVTIVWKRWSLRPQRPSAPLLRRFISGSFLTSAEPAPLLRLRPLRPPLPFLRCGAPQISLRGIVRAVVAALLFLRRLSLPCGQPASVSHRLPVRAAAHAPSLRRFSFPSVSAELISGRIPSSPLCASNPSGGRGERYARPARHGSVPLPSTARIQPPQAPAEPAPFRLRLCAGLSRPSLPFAPAPRPPGPGSAWVPTLRRLRITPLAPLSPVVLPSPPLRPRGLHLHRFRHFRAESSYIPPLVLCPVKPALLGFAGNPLFRSAPFQGTCLCYAPPPQAPAELHSGRFPFSPLRFSGCSPRLAWPPAAPCHFGVQPPQAPAEPHSCSLSPSGPHRRRLAFVPPPGNLPVHSRRQLAFRRLHSQPPSSAPWAGCHSGSIPMRSAQPARPLPSSSGAPQAAQPSCGVRSRAD